MSSTSKTSADTAPIAITTGEPAGIGPDLCLLMAQANRTNDLVVLGDKTLLAQRASRLGLAVEFDDYFPGCTIARAAKRLTVLSLPLAAPCVPGTLDPANSSYVLGLLDRAIDGCVNHEFRALVTAPIHKGVINDSGVAFQGHTDEKGIDLGYDGPAAG